MAQLISEDYLVPPPGYRSTEAGLFVAQLDDQSRRLTEDTRGLTVEALSWQPAPGMNTIGMLLAHNAIVEAFWIQAGVLGMKAPYEIDGALGIGMDDDGMPIPEQGGHPATLAGKDLAFHDDLLARARRYVNQHVAALSDADLETRRSRTRRDGTHESFNVRWVLYHLVEHFAGHYGQINLLAHQYRARGRS